MSDLVSFNLVILLSIIFSKNLLKECLVHTLAQMIS